jgi:prevent-host-death family protein
VKSVALEDFRDNAQSFVAFCRRTRQPIVIVRHGEEVARLVPRKRTLRECVQKCAQIFPKTREKHAKICVLGRLFEVPLTGGEFFDIISKDGAVPKW